MNLNLKENLICKGQTARIRYFVEFVAVSARLSSVNYSTKSRTYRISATDMMLV